MTREMLRGFVDEMQGTLMKEAFIKESGVMDWAARNKEHLTHGAELAGLGALAVPSAGKLRKIHAKETSPEEKRTAKYELGGLGILAAPSALHLGHAAWKKFRP